MKIRVMGTADECKQAQDFYRRIGRQSNIRACSVSEPYPNRGSSGLYRVYVDIEYNDIITIFSQFSPGGIHYATADSIIGLIRKHCRRDCRCNELVILDDEFYSELKDLIFKDFSCEVSE